MHLWFFFFATNPVELAFLGFVIESLIRIRQYGGSGRATGTWLQVSRGQQLVAATQSKRGVRQLPDAASNEVGYLIPYWGPPNRTVTSFVWRPFVTALRGKDMNGRVIQGCAARNDYRCEGPLDSRPRL